MNLKTSIALIAKRKEHQADNEEISFTSTFKNWYLEFYANPATNWKTEVKLSEQVGYDEWIDRTTGELLTNLCESIINEKIEELYLADLKEKRERKEGESLFENDYQAFLDLYRN